MKKIFFALIAAFTIQAPGQAQTIEWTNKHKSLLATAVTLHTLDWGQTKTIALNPDKYYETNPILGRHPSIGKVNTYFAVTALIVPTLAHFLPEWRSEILLVWVGVEAAVTSRNRFVLGIKTTW